MAYRLPPLSTLRVFEAAARHLSFKAAADELLLTPSAVSRSILTLEQWLGLALFSRGNRSIALTMAGTAYVAEVRDVLERLMRATDAIPGRGGGTIAISAAPSFGLKWLMPRLSRFKQLYPDITITLDTRQKLVELTREAVDIAIRMGSGPWPGLECRMLARQSLVPVCRPELAAGISGLDDLLAQPLLAVTSTVSDWDYWAAAKGVRLPRTARMLRFDTIHYAIDAALNGLGVALGRRPLVDPDLAAGNLVELLGPPVPEASAYWLVCAPPVLARPEIRAFRDWILAEAAGDAGSPGG